MATALPDISPYVVPTLSAFILLVNLFMIQARSLLQNKAAPHSQTGLVKRNCCVVNAIDCMGTL